MKHYRVTITPFAGENIREAHEWLEERRIQFLQCQLIGYD